MNKLLGLLAFLVVLPTQGLAETAFEQTRNNVALSCTTTTSSDSITPDNADYKVMLVTNSGTAKAYIRSGDSDVAATVLRGTPIVPDSQQLMKLPSSHTHIACITASGSAAVEISPGNGN